MTSLGLLKVLVHLLVQSLEPLAVPGQLNFGALHDFSLSFGWTGVPRSFELLDLLVLFLENILQLLLLVLRGFVVLVGIFFRELRFGERRLVDLALSNLLGLLRSWAFLQTTVALLVLFGLFGLFGAVGSDVGLYVVLLDDAHFMQLGLLVRFLLLLGQLLRLFGFALAFLLLELLIIHTA